MVLPDDSGVTGASLGVDNLRDEVCRQALRSNRVLISGIPLKLYVYIITKVRSNQGILIFIRVGHFFLYNNLSFVIITCELIINIEYLRSKVRRYNIIILF